SSDLQRCNHVHRGCHTHRAFMVYRTAFVNVTLWQDEIELDLKCHSVLLLRCDHPTSTDIPGRIVRPATMPKKDYLLQEGARRPLPKLQCTFDAFMHNRHLFDGECVGVGLKLRAADFRRPGILEVPFGDRLQTLVEHGDRAVAAGFVHLAIFHHLAPVPHVTHGGQAALEGDGLPFETTGQCLHQIVAVHIDDLVFDHFVFRTKPTNFGKEPGYTALNFEPEM